MTTYLLLFRNGKPEQSNLSPEAMQQHMQAWGTWIQQLAQSGNFKMGDPLDDGGKILTGTDKTLTDGPFAEAKDLIGGYIVLAAENLDHAVEIARGCPIFEVGGTVELRESRPM